MNGAWVGLNGFEVVVLFLNDKTDNFAVRVNKLAAYLWVGRGISRQRRHPSAHWRVAFGSEFSGQSLHRCPTLRHLKHHPSRRSLARSSSPSLNLRWVLSAPSVARVLLFRYTCRLTEACKTFCRAARAARIASDDVFGCSRIAS